MLARPKNIVKAVYESWPKQPIPGLPRAQDPPVRPFTPSPYSYSWGNIAKAAKDIKPRHGHKQAQWRTHGRGLGLWGCSGQRRGGGCGGAAAPPVEIFCCNCNRAVDLPKNRQTATPKLFSAYASGGAAINFFGQKSGETRGGGVPSTGPQHHLSAAYITKLNRTGKEAPGKQRVSRETRASHELC